ncbi:VanZ family protein [Clostridium taeniosporum]|uniref:VanZ family protein n=1 Tax=Clostridium taeniosporum TaxID=394958 RepID=A0A1D7XN58_9CLOT|nr:VanZ family protein [Clostridium taeniosporum]AOR24744.1 VanZ family protein [Clostridium taeniosporum]
MKRRLLLIILSLLCIIFIFFNSSQSGKYSQKRSRKIVNQVIPIVDECKFSNSLKSNNIKQKLNFVVRKCAHAFEYCMLAISLYLLFNDLSFKFNNCLIYTLFVVLLTAVLDETLQFFMIQRTSSVIDVLVDFSGGIIGVILSRIKPIIYLNRI